MSRDYDCYCPNCKAQNGVGRCYGQIDGGDADALLCRTCGASFAVLTVYKRLKTQGPDQRWGETKWDWEKTYEAAATEVCKMINKSGKKCD